MGYTKEEAIQEASKFLDKVHKLEQEHGFKINSDSGDIYLSFKKKEPYTGSMWDNVKIGWKGNGTGLMVTEVIKDKEFYRQQALSKLSPEEREALGV